MQAPAGRWQCRAWLFEYSVGAQDESYRPVGITVPGTYENSYCTRYRYPRFYEAPITSRACQPPLSPCQPVLAHG